MLFCFQNFYQDKKFKLIIIFSLRFQLNDGVTLFQRKFVNEVRRCDELERKIRYIEKEMSKNDIKVIDVENQDAIKAPYPRDIIDLEARLEKTENELLELSQNEANLAQNFLELTELKLVLESANTFFTDREVMNLDVSNGNGIDEGTHQQRGRLGFVAGVIERERVFAFERMLWRISRGNVFLKRADVAQPVKDLETGNESYKSTFVAFFQGEQLNSRIKKVCAGFHASIYPCPSNSPEREEMLKGVCMRLEDLKIVLNQTEDHRKRVLQSVRQDIPLFSIMVMKMKAIYHTMNFFNTDVTNKCLVAECWLPKADLQTVNEVLIKCSRECGCNVESFVNVIETTESPPTFNRTSRFTQGFQNLIDSYGVSSYREANPALYTIITFPFLFAVMFGDMGHGVILALFGIWMVVTEETHLAKKSDNEIWNIFFGGRYIIMLMGLFSIYTGFIYNDIFSLSLNIFGSKWFNTWNMSTVMDKGNDMLTMDPASDTRGIYPMGLDPIWQLAPQNKIIFHNSFKMKLSIIFGVSHMIFGVCMNLINYKHFNKMVDVFLEFLPRILFLVLLFGYLVFLMFFKWVKYSAQADDVTLQPTCAPSVLILFIEMMMMTPEPTPDPTDPNPSPCIYTMYEGEKTIEKAFVVIGLLCIPWMLLAKPLYIQLVQRKKVISWNYFLCLIFNFMFLLDCCFWKGN